ncbi:snare associated Golgi protein-domain-containing protein [Pterulicium gracile]|uniref:Snare associated Golgi protein-domain-containing protein n=1 Tax=Pterulicium gracile TaxID=1884261 RepID=A0A5C3QJ40_9AGAR|nr:snare associated Golgi protein-domain-containing protein [Pterula gracilis]
MRPFTRPNRPRSLTLQKEDIKLPESLTSSQSTLPAPPSAPFLFISQLLASLHFPHPPSHPPRLPSDDSILPLSAATSEFDVDIQSTKYTRVIFSPNNIPILTVILLFPVSTALILFSLKSLPITLTWPKTITDLAQLGTELRGYSQSSPSSMAHVIAVLSVTAVWKHAWSIPGSVVWNVLAGALFSPVLAVVLLSFLTMIGSACSTLLSAPLAPVLSHFFPRALDMTRAALQGSSRSKPDSTVQSAWIRLSVLRLIGVVPWSGINIACGVSGVPLFDCMLGAFIGTLPWTAVTCQIGDILQTVASHPSSPASQPVSALLASPAIITKLILLSVLSLAPILAKDRLKALIGHQEVDAAAAAVVTVDRIGRKSWVQEWRDKMRRSSRSRTRMLDETQLSELIREKRALPTDS